MLHIYHSCFTLTSTQNNIYPNAVHNRDLIFNIGADFMMAADWGVNVSVASGSKIGKGLNEVRRSEEGNFMDKIEQLSF